ncbi:hypothetical protein [uncultured Clostridium sp.]|uniref:hypothetical protein n=1 Tax=uncultured Clostridium sp. TaxID=59620 RepID=UPI0028EA275D|nr:hypothetical protein [uncultured Clostridium sp.]
MNFLLGAMILDVIANGNNDENSESGAGVLVTLGIVIYSIYKLQSIEQYILSIVLKDINLIFVLIIGLSILLPVYYYHSEKYKTLLIGYMLRILIYLDFFTGIGLMVYLSNILGSHPASFIFNISKVAYYGQSTNFFISLFASIAYLLIKILDFILVVGLIPLLQILMPTFIKKLIKDEK